MSDGEYCEDSSSEGSGSSGAESSGGEPQCVDSGGGEAEPEEPREGSDASRNSCEPAPGLMSDSQCGGNESDTRDAAPQHDRADVSSDPGQAPECSSDTFGANVQITPTETVRGDVTTSTVEIVTDHSALTVSEAHDASTGLTTQSVVYEDDAGNAVSVEQSQSSSEGGMTANQSEPPQNECAEPSADTSTDPTQRDFDQTAASSEPADAAAGQTDANMEPAAAAAFDQAMQATQATLQARFGDDFHGVSVQSYGPIREIWAEVAVDVSTPPIAKHMPIRTQREVRVRMWGVNVDTGEVFTDADLRSRDGEVEAEYGPIDFGLDLWSARGLVKDLVSAALRRGARAAVAEELSALARAGPDLAADVRIAVETIEPNPRLAAEALEDAESLSVNFESRAVAGGSETHMVLEPNPRLATRAADNAADAERGASNISRADDVWARREDVRGREIQDALGRTDYKEYIETDTLDGFQRSRNFPLVDFVSVDGTHAVSVKSYNPFAGRYASGDTIYDIVDHADELADFAPSSATKVTLDIRVPQNMPQDVIQELIDTVRSRVDNPRLEIVVTPWP